VSQEAGKLWYLKKIDLFEQLESEEMDQLADMTHVQDVPKNQPIYFPGDNADTIFMLKKGQVRLSRTTPEGKSITLAILEGGEIFGEMALGDKQERTTRAETTENSYICAAPREKFLEVVEKNPDLNIEITRMIGERKQRIESRLQNLIFKDSRDRVEYVLRDLFENHAHEQTDNDLPKLSLSHEQIGRLAGLTRPTTTSILNDLQEEGLIELGREKISLEAPRFLST
jgi:CRP/FNR family cyclic AMP-dependent transcriptional regulator